VQTMGAMRKSARKWILAVVAVAALATPSVWAASGDDAGTSFSIIALPDTQHYSERFPDIFVRQTEWIRDHKDELNLLCVVHEGDITNHNSEPEWANAEKALRCLDGVAPYCLAVGNHDMDTSGTARRRETAPFNARFPIARLQGQPWYGGHYRDTGENAFYLFDASGLKLLVVCLEFGPRDEVLEWANDVVARHKERRVIVVTHNYMYSDDTRSGPGDKWNPHDYGCGGNDGEEMWTKLVSRHRNIFLVLSGHILNDGLGRQTSTGARGNAVHEILANYQMHANGGNGWLRILEFYPRENRIRIRTYSPWLKQYADDGQNAFELDYDMQ